jgi:hypothetical protein
MSREMGDDVDGGSDIDEMADEMASGSLDDSGGGDDGGGDAGVD